MSTHSMLLYCGDCKENFYMRMEHHNRETLKKTAEETVCPSCQSKNWVMGDACER